MVACIAFDPQHQRALRPSWYAPFRRPALICFSRNLPWRIGRPRLPPPLLASTSTGAGDNARLPQHQIQHPAGYSTAAVQQWLRGSTTGSNGSRNSGCGDKRGKRRGRGKQAGCSSWPRVRPACLEPVDQVHPHVA